MSASGGHGPNWQLTEHCCGKCFGRVLTRSDMSVQVFRCAVCAEEQRGKVEMVCSCGVKLPGGKTAGMRCAKNTAKSPDWPGEIVAVQRP